MEGSEKLIILGVPFNGDGTTPEQENPGDSLRQAGLLECLQSGRRTVIDLGDVEIPEFGGKRDVETNIFNLHAWLKTSKSVAEMIASIDKNAFLLVLGGDCSILMGIFGGFALQSRRVGLVMLDGHTDYREPATSETGEPADIELAVISGRGPQRATEFFGKCPLVREEDVIVYGYREPDEIENSKIKCFDRFKLARMGIKQAVKKGLTGLEKRLPIWLHLDVDALDPSVIPVYYPEPDGLSIDEVTQFLDTCIETGRIIGLSIGCYHPSLDTTGQGAKSIISLLPSQTIFTKFWPENNPPNNTFGV
ncbi:MAG: arginase family protein [Anaerolineales bacterium]|nr:arginase family protein [Anaerolineales bacterium]